MHASCPAPYAHHGFGEHYHLPTLRTKHADPNIDVSYVHGLRIVLPNWGESFRDVDDGVPFQTVCLMDFNVHPKRVDDPYAPSSSPLPAEPLVNGTHPGQKAGRVTHEQGKGHVPGSTSYIDHLGTYTIVTEPTVLPADATFTENVESALPYSMTSRRFSAKYTGFMIDDQRLVGMKVRGNVVLELSVTVSSDPAHLPYITSASTFFLTRDLGRKS